MSLFKHVTIKQSVIASTAVVAIGLIAAAIYLKRKRRKSFPKIIPKPHNRSSKPNSETDTSILSPSSTKFLKQRHSRTNSFTTSTISSVSSSTTSSYRRLKKPCLSNSQERVVAETLYKEGVDSFEAAIEKWEKAADLLEKPQPSILSNSSSDTTLRESISDTTLHEPTSVQSYLENVPSEGVNGRTRYSSFSDFPSNDDSVYQNEVGDAASHRVHSNSESDVTEMVRLMKLEKGISMSTLQEQLQAIVKKAKKLQQTIDYVLYDENATDSDTDITLIGCDDEDGFLSGDDSASTASYFSAHEFWDTNSVGSHSKRLAMYEEALVAVERGEVVCRTSRASLLNCFSEDEFLAKLHCLRQGLEIMLQDSTVRNWFQESGQSMIECILCIGGQNISGFEEAFSNLLSFVSCPENWNEIEDELKGRKVFQMSFYDVVLDFVLMDAFDDLANPPAPVVSIMQNKWLADYLKESALYTAVWSVLKAKKIRLQYTNGFISRLYEISSHVTPVLAWGFMGPEGKLRDTCEYFKKEVIDFLQGLFSFDHIRYTTPHQMADDILKMSRQRFGSLTNYLQNSIAEELK